MNFQQLVEKTGFELAVVICHENGSLPPGVLKRMTRSQCEKVRVRAPNGGKLEALVSRLLKKLPFETFSDWYEAYEGGSFDADAFSGCESEEECEELALRKMLELAQTFEEWLEMHWTFSLFEDDCGEEKRRRSLASQNLRKLTVSISQCFEITRRVSPTNDLYAFALRRMDEVPQVFEQWLNVSQKAEWGKDLYNHAVERMAALAASFDEWRMVFSQARPDSGIRTTALRRLCELAAAA